MTILRADSTCGESWAEQQGRQPAASLPTVPPLLHCRALAQRSRSTPQRTSFTHVPGRGELTRHRQSAERDPGSPAHPLPALLPLCMLRHSPVRIFFPYSRYSVSRWVCTYSGVHMFAHTTLLRLEPRPERSRDYLPLRQRASDARALVGLPISSSCSVTTPTARPKSSIAPSSSLTAGPGGMARVRQQHSEIESHNQDDSIRLIYLVYLGLFYLYFAGKWS